MRETHKRRLAAGQTRLLQSAHKPLSKIAPYELMTASQTGPVVISAPHGGFTYPSDILSMNEERLRRFRSLEDTGTSLIASQLHAPHRPVIMACLSRGLLDLNRPADALDAQLYDGPLTRPLSGDTHYNAYVKAGYGVMPRLCANRQALHDTPLPVALADQLITQFHHPYHHALQALLDQAAPVAMVVDIHSMPNRSSGKALPDFVFGDDFNVSIPHDYRLMIDKIMADSPYSVGWNHPFAGGYITRHYGHRNGQQYSLQIEINRALYTNNHSNVSDKAMADIAACLETLISGIEELCTAQLAAQ